MKHKLEMLYIKLEVHNLEGVFFDKKGAGVSGYDHRLTCLCVQYKWRLRQVHFSTGTFTHAYYSFWSSLKDISLSECFFLRFLFQAVILCTSHKAVIYRLNNRNNKKCSSRTSSSKHSNFCVNSFIMWNSIMVGSVIISIDFSVLSVVAHPV